jgi:plastocyanin
MPTRSNRRSARSLRLLPLLCAALFGVLVAGPSPAAAAAPKCVDTIPGVEQECTYTTPITVKGYEVLQDIKIMSGANNAPQFPGYVTHMETDIVDANNAPVPISRLMLHHIVFINPLRPDKTCETVTEWDSRPGGFIRERFFAAGEERAKITMPDGYGYQIGSNNNWALLYMVMNHRKETDAAFIQYKVTVRTDPTGMTPVEPYWLDINDCHVDPIYNVPGTGKPGSIDVRSRDVAIQKDGRIVAGIGHVHGGAQQLNITQPWCGGRQIAQSLPTWGNADHPFYNVRPILHEPGPINMTAFRSEQGIPVQAGQLVRLNALYDNSKPHTRVMGIEQIYVAPDPSVDEPCGPLPTDTEILGGDQPGRKTPVPFTVPLVGLDAAGEAVNIPKPPGKLKKVRGGTTIQAGDRFFSEPNVQIYPKKGLTWEFSGNEIHNITLANGPAGIASENLNGGRKFWAHFPKKGTYNFFCSLHPVQMHERVVVKKKKKKGKKKKKRKRGKGKRK